MRILYRCTQCGARTTTKMLRFYDPQHPRAYDGPYCSTECIEAKNAEEAKTPTETK